MIKYHNILKFWKIKQPLRTSATAMKSLQRRRTVQTTHTEHNRIATTKIITITIIIDDRWSMIDERWPVIGDIYTNNEGKRKSEIRDDSKRQRRDEWSRASFCFWVFFLESESKRERERVFSSEMAMWRACLGL